MIKWIVIALLGLIILGYLGFDIREAIEAPATKSNIEYVKEAVVHVWNKFLKRPATYLWNDVFIELIWNTAIDNLTKIKNGEPTNYQTLPSQLPNP